jgi:addiction module RelE/StbE family toxin
VSRVRWTRPALRHLREIAQYIERDNPRAARRVVTFIRQQVTALADQPAMGREGRVHGTRELVITRLPYVVAYRLAGGAVEVLAETVPLPTGDTTIYRLAATGPDASGSP